MCRTPSEDAAGQVELFYEYAMMQHKQKDYRRAREGLEKVVAMDPTHRQALSALGLACTAMGDIEDGIRNYTAALKLDDTSKEVWINVFQCYKESGQVRRCFSGLLSRLCYWSVGLYDGLYEWDV